MPNSLQPHGLQHVRLPCPSLYSRVHSNFMYIELVMASNESHLLFPLSLLSLILPSIKVFSNESALWIRRPECWSFTFSISHSNAYSKLISFRIDWLDLPVVEGILKIVHQHRSSSRRWVDLNPARNQNLCHQCQAWVNAACPLSPIADDPSVRQSPTSSPASCQ